MTIGKTLLVLFFMVHVSGALAQIDPDPDGIGIYFDLEATQITATVEAGEPVTGYLIATNSSQEGDLALWEAYVSSTVFNVIIWGDPEYGINIAMNMPPGGPGFSFLVSPFTPLPQLQNVFLLGTLTITVLTEGPVGLQIHGNGYEFPMYRVDDLNGPDHFWYPSSGSVDLPVAVINGPAPVAVEAHSWGRVKSLFR